MRETGRSAARAMTGHRTREGAWRHTSNLVAKAASRTAKVAATQLFREFDVGIATVGDRA